MPNVIAAVQKAGSCYEAATVAESCAMGSSMDVGITQPAIEKCSKDFMAKLSKNKIDLSAYNRLLKRCGDKYAKMEGTMYRSAAAFCVLDINRVYSGVYSTAQ